MIYSSSMTPDKARSQIQELERQLEGIPNDPNNLTRSGIQMQIDTLKGWLKNAQSPPIQQPMGTVAFGYDNKRLNLANLRERKRLIQWQRDSRSMPSERKIFEERIVEIDIQIAKLEQEIASESKS